MGRSTGDAITSTYTLSKGMQKMRRQSGARAQCTKEKMGENKEKRGSSSRPGYIMHLPIASRSLYLSPSRQSSDSIMPGP